MKPNKFMAVAGLLLALAGVGILMQRQAIERAQAENASLSASMRNVQGNAASAVAPVPVTTARSAQDAAELESLRRESDSLHRQLTSLSSQEQTMAEAAAAARSLATTTVTPIETIKSVDARDSGQATPAATIQTFLWAVTHGETNRLASLMEFESGMNPALAKEFIDRMITELGKAAARPDGPMEVRVLSESSAGGNDRWITTQDSHQDGKWGDPEKVRFRLTDGGWRLLVGTNGEPVVDRQSQ
jgi:hypothetical protein